MLKLIRGVSNFRREARPAKLALFRELARGQRPDTYFVACSDSRAAPNAFASTDPGTLFVTRNAGNMIPHPSRQSFSEAAALGFAVKNLAVQHIVVCGHSGCGAMHAMLHPEEAVAQELRAWIDYAGDGTLSRFDPQQRRFPHFEPIDELALLNVFEQMEHIREYPFAAEAIQNNKLQIHGWFFDIKDCNVLAYDPESGEFKIIDDEYAPILLERLGHRSTP